MSWRSHVRACRGQSHVIGVALLLATTMISLGVLTASVGVVLDDSAAAVDADRVATDLDGALDPVAATGVGRGQVSFVDGRLRVVTREFRVLNDSGEVYHGDIGAIVFETDTTHVSFAGGLIASGGDGGATRYVDPPIAASEETLLIGVVRLNATGTRQVSTNGATTVPLRTDVSHERRALAEGTYRIAVETSTPYPWEQHFEATGAETTRRQFAGDDYESVVGQYDRKPSPYLVVHDLALEVGR